MMEIITKDELLHNKRKYFQAIKNGAVFIYPTGRAENASFVLRGPDNYSVTVTLRGLTGAVNIGPLEQEPAAEDELTPADKPLAPLEDLAEEEPSEHASY